MSALKIGRRVLGALLVFAAVGQGVAPEVGIAEARGAGPRRAMLALTNTDRMDRERDGLVFAGALARYAKHHSRQMATKGHLFHSTQAQLQRALSDYDWSIGGENVGVGSSLQSLEAAFMASAPHRQNILRRRFEHAAVGIVRKDGRIWITLIFFG